MKKNYILDTNILISSPNSIFGFDDNNVYITTTTFQELDKKKSLPGETGWGAREAIRNIDKCLNDGNLIDGIPLKNGGMLYALASVDSINEFLPSAYEKSPDNTIIATVKSLMLKDKDIETVLITNDISMKINALNCNVATQEYKNDRIAGENKYTGKTEIFTSIDNINELYNNKKISADIVDYLFTENEFVIIRAFEHSNTTALAIYQSGMLKLINSKKTVYNVTPKNAAQAFALYALTAPVDEIPFVILQGEAGTAKTFLSLAAGLEQIDYDAESNRNNNSSYNKVLITRNNVTSDDDFGYLPGDIDEKMTPLLSPFYDNLESLIRGNNEKEENEQIQLQINDLFETGIIKVCPLAYMRGRSITNSYLIVDEAQNSSRSQMRDIITRAGKGTKIVICGDPKQIDNIHLDKFNNGLAFAANKMKGSKLCAQITFSEQESVRSALASEALKRLEVK